MENQEAVLLELDGKEFANSTNEDVEISQNLENFIEYVSKTGTYVFPWNKIKPLYVKKMSRVIDNFHENSTVESKENMDEMKERIIERFQSFTHAPFTIQRISELLMKPQVNYSRKEKFLSGLEKCVMVVTCVDPQGKYLYN